MKCPTLLQIVQYLEIIQESSQIVEIICNYFQTTHYDSILGSSFDQPLNTYSLSEHCPKFNALLHTIRSLIGESLYDDIIDNFYHNGHDILTQAVAPSLYFQQKGCISCDTLRFFHTFCYSCGMMFDITDEVRLQISSKPDKAYYPEYIKTKAMFMTGFRVDDQLVNEALLRGISYLESLLEEKHYQYNAGDMLFLIRILSNMIYNGSDDNNLSSSGSNLSSTIHMKLLTLYRKLVYQWIQLMQVVIDIPHNKVLLDIEAKSTLLVRLEDMAEGYHIVSRIFLPNTANEVNKCTSSSLLPDFSKNKNSSITRLYYQYVDRRNYYHDKNPIESLPSHTNDTSSISVREKSCNSLNSHPCVPVRSSSSNYKHSSVSSASSSSSSTSSSASSSSSNMNPVPYKEMNVIQYKADDKIDQHMNNAFSIPTCTSHSISLNKKNTIHPVQAVSSETHLFMSLSSPAVDACSVSNSSMTQSTSLNNDKKSLLPSNTRKKTGNKRIISNYLRMKYKEYKANTTWIDASIETPPILPVLSKLLGVPYNDNIEIGSRSTNSNSNNNSNNNSIDSVNNGNPAELKSISSRLAVKNNMTIDNRVSMNTIDKLCVEKDPNIISVPHEVNTYISSPHISDRLISPSYVTKSQISDHNTSHLSDQDVIDLSKIDDSDSNSGQDSDSGKDSDKGKGVNTTRNNKIRHSTRARKKVIRYGGNYFDTMNYMLHFGSTKNDIYSNTKSTKQLNYTSNSNKKPRMEPTNDDDNYDGILISQLTSSTPNTVNTTTVTLSQDTVKTMNIHPSYDSKESDNFHPHKNRKADVEIIDMTMISSSDDDDDEEGMKDNEYTTQRVRATHIKSNNSIVASPLLKTSLKIQNNNSHKTRKKISSHRSNSMTSLKHGNESNVYTRYSATSEDSNDINDGDDINDDVDDRDYEEEEDNHMRNGNDNNSDYCSDDDNKDDDDGSMHIYPGVTITSSSSSSVAAVKANINSTFSNNSIHHTQNRNTSVPTCILYSHTMLDSLKSKDFPIDHIKNKQQNSTMKTSSNSSSSSSSNNNNNNNNNNSKKKDDLYSIQDLLASCHSILNKHLPTYSMKEICNYDISNTLNEEEAPIWPKYICSNCLYVCKKAMEYCSECSFPLPITAIHHQVITDMLCKLYFWHSSGIKTQFKGIPISLLTPLKYLSQARNYKTFHEAGRFVFEAQCYFVTHLLYFFSDYGHHTLSRQIFAEEFEYLVMNLYTVQYELHDPDILGEMIHGLYILQYSPERAEDTWLTCHIEMSKQYILTCEQKQGKHGYTINIQENERIYTIYHSTFAMIVALLIPSYTRHISAREHPPLPLVFQYIQDISRIQS